MTEIEKLNEEGGATGDMALVGEEPSSHLVSMQVLQDVYNELTGKTEELSKGYEIPYQICFADIEQLNTKITQLYEQYNIKSSNCSVTVYHEKDQKQVFSSFERFKFYDQSLLSPTESILIKYNFLIVLPKLSRPQSYSVSVRIGSKVTMLKKLEEDNLPSMIIKMVSGRSAQVTVEYIDYTVARNFIDTIDAWFKSIDTAKFASTYKTLQKYSHYISPIAKFSVGLFSGYLCLKYSFIFVLPNIDYLQLYKIALITFAFIFITYSLAKFFGKIAEKNVDLMTELSFLKLNRGDEKEIEVFKSKNRKGLIRATLSIIATFGIGVLSSIVAAIIMT